MRQLNKSQVKDLEQLKLDVFTNLDVHENVTPKTIFTKLKSGKRTDEGLRKTMEENNVNLDNMNIDDYRKYIIGCMSNRKSANTQFFNILCIIFTRATYENI